MRFLLPFVLLVLVGSVACSSSRLSTTAFAKTQRTKLGYDQDTLLVDVRDTILLDALGQLYHWGQDNSLEKVRSANQLGIVDSIGFRYQNPRLGKLKSVDFTNPIRPLLFYQDAQTVVWLNRNLTEWRRINLLDVGFSAIDAVAYAPNEGLWLFASDLQRLIQVDLNGKVISQSAELNQVFNQAVRAEQIVANAQQIVMRTSGGRLLRFGPFGAYRSEILQGGTGLHLVKERLIFHEGQKWFSYRGAQLPIEAVSPLGDKELVSLGVEYTLYRRGTRYWREANNK